jgi:hypothetical protein
VLHFAFISLQIFSFISNFIAYRKTIQLSRYGDGLWDVRPRFDSKQGQDFSFLNSTQTGTGVHPSSYVMGTIGFLSGCKAAGP